MLDHFTARQQYETRDFSRFDTAGLIRYREEKKQFAGDRYETLYDRWRAGGAAAVLAVLQPDRESAEIPPMERFSTYVLEYDYEMFGTLTSAPESIVEKTQVQTQP